jgi:DNA repair photolyase
MSQVVFEEKTNAADVLRQQLRRPSWAGETIVLGTACDPYQQAELRYGLTRKMLSVFVEFSQSVHTLTKSPNIIRDINLWKRLAGIADTQVAFSVPTLDHDVWRKTEPGTAKPGKRLEAMRRLADAGVPCGVMLAPVIPGVTDTEESIDAVMRASAEHGASFVIPSVLYLKPGTREWFMPVLREAYPHLEARYERYYRGTFAPEDYTRGVIARVAQARAKYGLDRPAQGKHFRPAGQLRMAL